MKDSHMNFNWYEITKPYLKHNIIPLHADTPISKQSEIPIERNIDQNVPFLENERKKERKEDRKKKKEKEIETKDTKERKER